MGKIEKFEDLEAWKSSRHGVNLIYGSFRDIHDYCFRDQILRASISVMNNIAEGFSRQSIRERLNFMNIAYGSLMEVRSMLYLGKDLCYVSEVRFEDLMQNNLKTIQILSGFMRYLHSQKRL